LLEAARHPELGFLLVAYFAFIFAFSNMEQTFSLLFQERFGFDTGTAGYRTGVVLMVSGLMGAVVQGGLIRKLIPKYGERKLLLAGLAINALTMGFFPFLPGYAAYFPFAVLMALGTGLINPTLNGLISRAARDDEQGRVLGISQGLGSLARAFGPFCGLLTFQIDASIPYLIAAAISLALLAAGTKRWIGTAASSTVSP
jgi:MFS family permease